MFGRMDGRNKFGIKNSIRMRNDGIVDAVITNHFEVFIRDMDDKPFDKINSGNGFNDEFMIFMPVVVESNGRTVIRVDTGSGNNGSA